MMRYLAISIFLVSMHSSQTELFDSDQQRFIPLISDYGFKATFGNEANSLFLHQALRALIQSEAPINEVTFLPHELSRLTKDGRSGIYDLACRDANGVFFIVEMQMSDYPEFIQRMKFYSLYRFYTLVKKEIIHSRSYRKFTALVF